MNDPVFITIIVPCRNEKRYIGKCLDSIVSQSYPKDKFEVLVVDGMSEDETREVVGEYAKRCPFIKILDNPKRITPISMNIGINNAKGDIIMKIDAHTIYKKDYISNCVKYLKEYNADNIGGILKATAENNTLISKSIVLSISSPFGVGSSYFRIGCREPKWVDTVAFGCYKREVFEKIGIYNEKLARSQDIELNLRLKKAGGKILLHPDIIGYYYPPSEFTAFLRHSFINGLWAILPFKYTDIMPVSLRHLVPLGFVLGLFGALLLSLFLNIFWWIFLFIILSYIIVNLYFSFKITMKEKDLRLLFAMPAIFVIFHFSYGLGSVLGLIKCALSKWF